MKLGAKVRLRRKMLGLSQGQLSRQTGISRPYITQIENGDHSPSAPVLAALAKGLKCTADYLVADEIRGRKAG